MFVKHTIISEILINVLFITCISVLAVEQLPFDSTGYASSIQMIFLHDSNWNLTMVVLQLVQPRIFSSSRPLYLHVRCEALEWLRKAARLTDTHTYFLCSAPQWACWIEWHWYLLHIHHHPLCKQIRQVFYKVYHQLCYFHQVLTSLPSNQICWLLFSNLLFSPSRKVKRFNHTRWSSEN